jgi:hypothetical protein
MDSLEEVVAQVWMFWFYLVYGAARLKNWGKLKALSNGIGSTMAGYIRPNDTKPSSLMY